MAAGLVGSLGRYAGNTAPGANVYDKLDLGLAGVVALLAGVVLLLNGLVAKKEKTRK